MTRKLLLFFNINKKLNFSLKNMWIELITYVSTKKEIDQYLVLLLDKFVKQIY